MAVVGLLQLSLTLVMEGKDEILAVVIYAMNTEALKLEVDSDDENGIVSVYDRKNEHLILRHDRHENNEVKCSFEQISTSSIDVGELDRDELEVIARAFFNISEQVELISEQIATVI
jgi:hypothetical protein